MLGVGPIAQDWELVAIRKKASTAATRKDEKADNVTCHFDAEIKTINKFLIEKEILRLQIIMEDAAGVTEFGSGYQLLEIPAAEIFTKLSFFDLRQNISPPFKNSDITFIS